MYGIFDFDEGNGVYDVFGPHDYERLKELESKKHEDNRRSDPTEDLTDIQLDIPY